MRHKEKGFTLTELLVVIAIICILAAVAIPIFTGMLNKSTEQTDEVSAGLYSSIMQRFANEKPGDAFLYPSLSTTGTDSEYSILYKKAGKGLFPGYNTLVYDNDEDVYDAIRKEAVIAIKAYSDVKVLDGYYVPAPAKEDCHYVYYYLTGEVKIESEAAKTPISKADVQNDIINTEDYWVYLDSDGGSGEAILNDENGKGMVFVQVRQFGTDKLLDNVTVSLNSGYEIKSAKTGANGTVGFAGIDLGVVNISTEKLGAISFPNSQFYEGTGELRVKNGGYVGDSAANPYVITLKMGSLGSLGFYRRTNTWNGASWTSTDEYLTENVDITSVFTVDISRDAGIAREETYKTNPSVSGGVQELLTPDGKFLLYGPYLLQIKADNFRTHSEYVQSKVYGIDNDNNGGKGDYADAASPYEYPIIMKRPEGSGSVSGTIYWERQQQPLAGTSSESGTWVSGHTNYTVNTRVMMTNRTTGKIYYSSYFALNESGSYPYSVNNLPDGDYSIALQTPYGNSGILTCSNLPDTVTVDGTEIIVNGRVYYSDVAYGSTRVTVTYDSRGTYDPIQGATIKVKRLGMTTTYSGTSNQSGQYSFSSMKKGFYQLTITVPSYIGTQSYTYKYFVDGSENLVIRMPIPAITISGTIYGYRPDGSAMNVSGSFSGMKMTFFRYSQDGKRLYSSKYATMYTNGLTASYSISIVPGMYKISTDVTCYLDYSGAGTLVNFKTTQTKYISLTIDGNNVACHPNEKISWEQDATYHWRACSKCGTVFDKEKHKASAWTASGASGCYRYCTESNCKRTLDPVTAHNYQYKANGSYNSTCVVNGNRHYECSRCSYGKDESIPKTGHNFGSWTADNESTHSRTCRNSGCGTKETANHSFGSWYWTSHDIQMSPSGSYCYSTGTQRSDCITCGYYKTNQPKVAHATECYMMREYVNDDMYYNMPTNVSVAYFKLPSGRIYMRLQDHTQYSGRRVYTPANPDNGGFGFITIFMERSETIYAHSAIFGNTNSSHYTACSNTPVIDGVTHYCYAPINHIGDPLRSSNHCGCLNAPLGYVVNAYGEEIKPKLNPAWESPYEKYGR